MQNIFELFKAIISQLEDNRISYMVVGPVASIIYGEPRMTRDMDLVIDLQAPDVRRFVGLFPFKDFYCPPEDIISAEIIERGQFNLIHHENGLKIDMMVRKNSEHARTEFSRRLKIPFWENFEAYVATPEDVILKKLVYFREGASEKHLRDIRGMLAQNSMDMDYLNTWLQKLRLEDEWAKV